MKSLFFNLTFLGFVAAACSQTGNNTQQLQAEIIAKHDSIMPKMGDFVRDNLKITQLLTHMDSLKKVNPTLDTLAEKTQLQQLQADLTKAHDAMDDWMHQFEPGQEGRSPTETQQYLETELTKVNTLKNQFNQVDISREQLLSKYKN